ncbi:MAG TPA: hypothetical protein VIG66_00840 [Noviherbaspirillum sp.]
MSLINQMLKDLDARRAEAAGPGPFGEQVRAVPAERGVHPAWWLVLVLALVLAGVIAWMLTRPPAPDPYLMQAQLPLKFEAGLTLPKPSPVHAEIAMAPNAATSAPLQAGATGAAAAQAVEPAGEGPLAAPAANVSVASARPARAEGNPEPAAQPVPAAPGTTVSAELPRARQAQEPATLAQGGSEANPQEQPLRKQVRELSPQQQAENEFRKAALALRQHKKQEALAGFQQALQLDARHAEARQSAIAMLLEERRTREALSLAAEGLAIDERQIGFAMILARLQLESGELPAALATLANSRRHAASDAAYLAFDAALLQRNGQHKEAAEQYMQALRLSSTNGVWWMGLGISLQAEHRLAEAREAFQRARASNTLSPDLVAFVDARLAQLK